MKKYNLMIAVVLTVALFPLFIGVGLVCAEGRAELYMSDATGTSRLQHVKVSVNAEQALRLMANVPEGKILKAYNITIVYDQNIVGFSKAVPSQGSPLAPRNINADTPGLITINGFDVTGMEGNGIPLSDFVFLGKMPGVFQLVISPNSFGSSAADVFIPLTDTIEVSVQ